MQVGDWRQGFGSPLIRMPQINQPLTHVAYSVWSGLDRMESFHPFNHEELKELIILKYGENYVYHLPPSVNWPSGCQANIDRLFRRLSPLCFLGCGWELVLMPGIVRTRAISGRVTDTAFLIVLVFKITLFEWSNGLNSFHQSISQPGAQGMAQLGS
jgi:hypothetical protein